MKLHTCIWFLRNRVLLGIWYFKSRFLWYLDDLFKSGKLKTSDLSPHLQKYFVKDGSFVKLGMKIIRTDLADILQEISEKGSLALYNGKYTSEITDVVSIYKTVLWMRFYVFLGYHCCFYSTANFTVYQWLLILFL